MADYDRRSCCFFSFQVATDLVARVPHPNCPVRVDRSIGILLLNIGSPDAPTTTAVRRYLREFLSDSFVLDIPALPRWLLLNGLILPFRSSRSAAAYRTIWSEEGSPLIVNSHALAAAVSQALEQRRPDTFVVRAAMRYGHPGIPEVLTEFEKLGIRRLFVLPLYPQYATSSYASALSVAYRWLARRWNSPAIEVIPPFFDEPGYLTVLERSLSASLGDHQFDHLLLSFHGLPERHIRKSDPGGTCLTENCCERARAGDSYCYRAQCYVTARLTAAALGLPPEAWSVSFQSRLGRTPWIRPFTDQRLEELGRQGLRLVTAAPSFTADCLETLEELAVRGGEAFLAAGGKDYRYLPCLNADPAWAAYLTDRIIKRAAHP